MSNFYNWCTPKLVSLSFLNYWTSLAILINSIVPKASKFNPSLVVFMFPKWKFQNCCTFTTFCSFQELACFLQAFWSLQLPSQLEKCSFTIPQWLLFSFTSTFVTQNWEMCFSQNHNDYCPHSPHLLSHIIVKHASQKIRVTIVLTHFSFYHTKLRNILLTKNHINFSLHTVTSFLA